MFYVVLPTILYSVRIDNCHTDIIVYAVRNRVQLKIKATSSGSCNRVLIV